MKYKLSLLIMLFFTTQLYSQKSTNVLFIGNSYTDVNDLPALVKNVAASMGDEVLYERNTPGGCKFADHCTNNSMNLIRKGGWDFVVLQEQSQYPAFPINQVKSEVFPYAKKLVDSVYANSPCAIPIFYMTWGRKNGDHANGAVYPPIGTYSGMDSLLYERYMIMKEDNETAVSPVGRVWHYIRDNYPHIELYNADESHPSMAGSYAAACSFYTMFFENNPLNITYNSTLNSKVASDIRMAVKIVVFDSLDKWKREGISEVNAGFSYEINDSLVSFNNTSTEVKTYNWNFGDGNISKEKNPVHVFEFEKDSADFAITLIAAYYCEVSDTAIKQIRLHRHYGGGDEPGDSTSISNYSENQIKIYPNPVENMLTIEGLDEKVEYEIFNTEGRLLKRAYGKSINVSDLSKGVYILKMDNFIFKFKKR